MSRRGRPSLFGWLCLQIAVARMESADRRSVPDEVIRIGEKYERRWKGSARFYRRLAGGYWSQSRWAQAIRAGRQALAIDPTLSPVVVFLLASYRATNPQRGIDFGEHWLRRQPVTADVCRHLSFLYDDLGRPGDALVVAKRGIAAYPHDRRLVACAAHFLAKAEGAEKALSYVQANRVLLEDDPYCESTIAHGLFAAGAFAEAVRRFDALYRRHRNDAGFCAALLEARYAAGQYAELVAEAEDWDRRNPMTAHIANEAGRACVELRRPDDALAWMDRARKIAPEKPLYADNYAVVLERVGRYEEAITAAKRRLESPDCDRRRMLTSLGISQGVLGRDAEALACFEAALAEQPDHPDGIANYLDALTTARRFADAVELGRKHRGVPHLPRHFWREFAWALDEVGDFAEEERVVAEWGARYPDDIDLPRAGKRALNQLGRKEEALAYVRAWAERHADWAWAWRFVAEQQEVCQDQAGEREAMDQACRLLPGHPEFAAEKVSILRRQERAAEALDFGAAWVAAHSHQTSGLLLNRLGLAADDLERWTEAEDYYRRAHAADPANATFAGNVIRAVVLQGRAAEGVAFAQGWIGKHEPNSYFSASHAWALRDVKRYDEESVVLRAALDRDPRHPDLSFSLLRSLILQQRTEDAAAWIKDCERSGTLTSGMMNDWGNHLLDLGRREETEAAYRQALALSPKNDVAFGNLTSFLADNGRADEAVQACRDWVAKYGEDARVRRQHAHACYQGGRYEEAEALYRELQKAEPKTPFFVERRIACLRLLERYEEALAEAQRWLEQENGSTFLYVEMSLVAHRLSRLEEALGHIERALALTPGSPTAASRKVRLLGELDRLDLATDFGGKWLAEHGPTANSTFFNDYGIVLDRAGRLDEARRCFRKALDLEPADATIAANTIELLGRAGCVDEAIAQAQQFLANMPPTAFLLRRLAELYGRRGEHHAAMDVLATADALEPDNLSVALAFLQEAVDADELSRGVTFGRAWLARPENGGVAAVWSKLARVCFRENNDEEAFAALQKAIDLEPDNLRLIQQRYAFWNALENSRAILTDFRTLRGEWRDDAEILRFVSRAYRELGLNEEALENARRNVALNPADEDANAWLADLYDQTGGTDQARESLESWIAVHGPQPAVLLVRARLRFDAQEHAAALADAEMVLEQDSSNEDAFVLRIRALRALGRSLEARQRLNHWLEHHDTSPRISRLFDEQPQE